MDRFPLLNTVRVLLYAAAALIIVGGVLASVGIARQAGDEIYNSDTREFERETNVGVFIGAFIFFLISALWFVLMAESIKLGLFIEDHLYHIRSSLTSGGVLSGDRSSSSISEALGTGSYGSSSKNESSTPGHYQPTGSGVLPDSSDAVLHPDPVENAFRKGMKAYRKQDFWKAVSEFTVAIERDPRRKSAYYYRSLAYRQLGNHKHADADMKKYDRL